jgi:hypothetical protein
MVIFSRNRDHRVFCLNNPILTVLCVSNLDQSVSQLLAERLCDQQLLTLFTLPLTNLQRNLQRIVSPDTNHERHVFERVKAAVLQVLRAGGSAFGKHGQEWIALVEGHYGMVEEADEFRIAYDDIPFMEEEVIEEVDRVIT